VKSLFIFTIVQLYFLAACKIISANIYIHDFYHHIAPVNSDSYIYYRQHIAAFAISTTIYTGVWF